MVASTKRHGKVTPVQQKRAAVQRQNLIWIVFGLVAAGLVVLLLIFNMRTQGGGTRDFTADTLTGESVRLSDYRGQVVMLNFWATWCPPCRAEMPTIQAAYERYHEQGFTVLAINNAEYPAQIQPFAETLALRFPIVLDVDGRLQRTFGIMGYPTSIFLGANGETLATHSGMVTPDQLASYIETGLAQARENPVS